MTGEIPSFSSELEQRVSEVAPEVGASTTSFDEAKESPRADIPFPTTLIGKSFLVSLPMKHDIGGRPMERGETSSRPFLQYAKSVEERLEFMDRDSLFRTFRSWVWHDQACAGDTCRE